VKAFRDGLNNTFIIIWFVVLCMRLDETKATSAFKYTPEEYKENCVLHWCLPFGKPINRTFTANKFKSGSIHLVELKYGDSSPPIEHSTRERLHSMNAGRASRRIKQGKAKECPFCSDATEFKLGQSRLEANHNYDSEKRWQAEVLEDFKQTVIESCRSEENGDSTTDIQFAEMTTTEYGYPNLEILTNTSSLLYAYPTTSIPNWYTLSYAIAQNPWLTVKEVTEFESSHVRILLGSKIPQEDEYETDAYRLLSQRDTAPEETLQA